MPMMAPPTPRKVPELLDAINRTGKKIATVAQEAGINPCSLSRVLNRRMLLRQHEADKLAEVLGRPASELGDIIG